MRGTDAELNPLVEIEQRVQARAKDLVLDLAEPAGEAELRDLIESEIEQWTDDFKRGGRPFELAGPDVVAERAFRNLARYGPLTPLLEDGDVWEIMINAPDAIFVKRHAGQSGYHDDVFHDGEHLTRTLTKLLDDSSSSHRKLDPAEGLQDAQLDDGSRLHIVHGDVSRGGHLMVNIRKFTGITFRSLDELVQRDMLSSQVAGFLAACVRADLSIVFAGAPGSGKTTLLSCCAAELDPSRRVVIAEEVFEADVPLANVASMQTRAARSDRPAVDLRRLVSGFLRMAPDVAIVGEVRDREAPPRSPYPPLTCTYVQDHAHYRTTAATFVDDRLTIGEIAATFGAAPQIGTDEDTPAGGTVALADRVGCGEAVVMKRRGSCPPSRIGLSAFAGFRFPPEVIMLAVRWYLRFGLSYRDLEELLAERGIEVDHVTLFRWVQRFTPVLIDAARPCRHAVGNRWFVDETYVKVSGVWRYGYRAVDQQDQVIDVYLSARRDVAAARRFFTTALGAHGAPAEVVTDLAPALERVVEDLLPTAFLNTDKHANNRVECDHGRLKARLRPMRGLKRDRTAQVIIAGHAFMQNLRRGHYELGVDALPMLRMAAAFDELLGTV